MTEMLSAETHFAALREPVWRRFHGRHPVYTRDRFEEAYAEWWTRELERGAAGQPSRPSAPVAFVAEAVHRVLIDEGRAMARGLARGEEKQGLEVVGLDERLDLAGEADETLTDARYRLVVHRILDLVRERLTTRELQVFIFSYLYMQTTSLTARSLGMSLPRVKKDRQKIAGKVGEEVWSILGSELDLCSAYEERHLPAVLELLTLHVDGCPRCREALRGVRREAFAVAGPVEVLALGGVAGTGSAGLLDHVVARVSGWVHRAAEVTASVPPGGRTAATVTVVAAAAVGGGVAVERSVSPERPEARSAPARRESVRGPAQGVARSPTVVPPAAAAPAPTAEPARSRSSSSRRASRRANARHGTQRRRASATPPPTPPPASAVTAAPAPTSIPAAPPPPAPAPSRPSGGSEFGFERGG